MYPYFDTSYAVVPRKSAFLKEAEKIFNIDYKY